MEMEERDIEMEENRQRLLAYGVSYPSLVAMLREGGTIPEHVIKYINDPDVPFTDVPVETQMDRYKILLTFLSDECHGNVSEMSRRIGVSQSTGWLYSRGKQRVPMDIRNRLEMYRRQQEYDTIRLAEYNKSCGK